MGRSKADTTMFEGDMRVPSPVPPLDLHAIPWSEESVWHININWEAVGNVLGGRLLVSP